MGYSCNVKASNVMDNVMATNTLPHSNGWFDEKGRYCFYEIGREQKDGAIVATVWRAREAGPYRDGMWGDVSGRVRIEGNGTVTKWSYANKAMREQIKNEHAVINAFAGGAMFVVV